jgi:hypothetical protein
MTWIKSKKTISQKQPEEKRAGIVTQVVESLLTNVKP